ncbi:hypothetical protein XELAEV_18043244mg [Xenopus laevis]|uniref:Syndecan/Neurexin domain-containing protein n=1 Tax=Xenopus laevis TaxID=8355 RepID=A0A974BX56_XENLA|nr:hypothetical protein XELAEV_18043244mg [Xenopus laevis]
MNRLLLLLALVLSGVAAESIRETETMDPTSMLEYESSGSFTDEVFVDEDDDDDYEDDVDYEIDSESDNDEDYSGSGDDDFDDEDNVEDEDEEETTTLGNQIPEHDFDETKTGRKFDTFNENNEIDNDIRHPAKPKTLEPSNEIPMASIGSSGFFQRTEVIVAIIAGTLVGLVVAVSFIVFLVIRRNQNGDLVKKPIYKKTSTMEV